MILLIMLCVMCRFGRLLVVVRVMVVIRMVFLLLVCISLMIGRGFLRVRSLRVLIRFVRWILMSLTVGVSRLMLFSVIRFGLLIL